MSRKHSLRNRAKVVAEIEEENEVDVEGGIAVTVDASPTPAPTPAPTPVEDCDVMNIMNMDLYEKLVEKFGTRVMQDMGAIVEGLKADLLAEFKNRDAKIVELESEVICLRDTIAISASNHATLNAKFTALDAKHTALEAKVTELLTNRATDPTATALPCPPRPIIDVVIAGDSIVKHVDIESIEGNNRLICLPGARANRVMAAVRKLAKTADIKDLVLHYGTNNLPQQQLLTVCHEIRDSLHRAQHEMPNTNIHFSAILPKIDESANRGINFVNNYACDVTNDLEIGFVQHSSFCENGYLVRKLYSPSEWEKGRPLHPSHEGARLLTNNFKLHLATK